MVEHEIQIRVRYSETDAMGFLHHGSYVNYFENGRIELNRALGGDYRAVEEGGLFLVVVKLEIRYASPARFDDLLTLTTQVASISPAKFMHEYVLKRDNTLIATAKTTLACVDRSGSIRRIPDDVRKLVDAGDE
ncbi:MAG: thioesterase family protein [Planctomycetota bacterium]|nr:thioesterase family protein [Planctomycetota bacterium]